MLEGVDTPKIDIPFSITIANACSRTNLDLFDLDVPDTNLNSLLDEPKFQ